MRVRILCRPVEPIIGMFCALLLAVSCTLESPSALPVADAQTGVLPQDLRRVPASVARYETARFEGIPGFTFTLTPQGREGGDSRERRPGRQRIELRDHNGVGAGLVRYEIEFYLPEFKDKNGNLETQVVIFQLKPQFVREGTEHIPYMTIELPEYYDERGLAVYFDFDLRKGKRGVADDRRAPLGLNRWHRLRTDVNWTDSAEGFARVYFNDRLIADYVGPTGPDQARAFAQFGLYRSDLRRIGSDGLETLVLHTRNYRTTRLSQ